MSGQIFAEEEAFATFIQYILYWYYLLSILLNHHKMPSVAAEEVSRDAKSVRSLGVCRMCVWQSLAQNPNNKRFGTNKLNKV